MEENTENKKQIHWEIDTLRWQGRGAAAPDTGSSSSVAVRKWLTMFIEDLEEDDRRQVKGSEASNKILSFGSNKRRKSEEIRHSRENTQNSGNDQAGSNFIRYSAAAIQNCDGNYEDNSGSAEL